MAAFAFGVPFTSLSRPEVAVASASACSQPARAVGSSVQPAPSPARLSRSFFANNATTTARLPGSKGLARDRMFQREQMTAVPGASTAGMRFEVVCLKKVIIAGAPASGKGTQCEMIVSKFGLAHVSTGDILRAAVAEGTEMGLAAKKYMDAGELVPDDVIIGIVKDRLKEEDCQKSGWLLDGFPRTAPQADAMQAAGIVADLFLVLDVPDEILIDRIAGRRTDPETGRIYHLTFSPPESPEVAARLVQRSDDDPEKMKVRVAAYHKHIDAVADSFKAVLKRVDGNRDKSTVFAELDALISAI